MERLLLWLKAVRAPFFSASLIPALAGAALSSSEGIFNFWALGGALLVTLFNHAGANVINDYFDAEGSDLINTKPTPFSGGSRFIQEGILTKKVYLKMAQIFYFIGLITAILLSFVYRNPYILLLNIMGTALGVGYSSSRTFGMGRGWGEIVVGIGFGPLAVSGSYLLQTNALSWRAFFVGIPIGFLIMGVLILNEFPDYEADKATQKKNWIVRAGVGNLGVFIYLSVIVLAYLTILWGVIIGVFSYRIFFTYCTIPLAIWVSLKLWRHRNQVPDLLPACAGNIGLHFLTGLLLCFGLWFE